MKKQLHPDGRELTDAEQLAAYDPITEKEWEEMGSLSRRPWRNLSALNTFRAPQRAKWEAQLIKSQPQKPQ